MIAELPDLSINFRVIFFFSVHYVVHSFEDVFDFFLLFFAHVVIVLSRVLLVL